MRYYKNQNSNFEDALYEVAPINNKAYNQKYAAAYFWHCETETE